MKKKLLTLIVFACVGLTPFVFTGCGSASGDPGGGNGGEGGSHNHTYTSEWFNNDTHHWKNCEIEDCDEKSSYEIHVYDNNCDVDCNTCNYTRTVSHDFSGDYENNETHHWKECATDGCLEKSEYFSHSYDDNCDTTCNTCGRTRTVTHNYDTEWSGNNTHHWKNCECGEKDEYAEHEFDGDVCEICEFEKYTEGLAYSYRSDDDSYVVEGRGSALNNTVIKIPAVYDDGEHGEKPVKHIAENAFKNDTVIEELKLPSDITNLLMGSLQGCNNLKKLTLPKIQCNGSNNTHLAVLFGAQFSDYSNVNSYVPASLKEVIVTGNGEISYRAFENCAFIQKVTLMDSVTAIGYDAFKGCGMLMEVLLPSGLTEIPEGAFSSCISLQNINIPNTVKTIGNEAFINCSNLSVVSLSNDLTTIGEKVFESSGIASIEIPFGVVTIPEKAFFGCTQLSEVWLSGSVTTIGEYAFYGCDNLATVVGGISIEVIEDCAFGDSPNLEVFTFTQTIKSIGEYAFSGNTKLKEVCLDGDISYIGIGAFKDCSVLERLTVPFVGESKTTTTNTYLGHIFGAESYLENAEFVPESLVSVNIIGSSKIYGGAFRGLNNIESITIADTVTEFGQGAFGGCSSLKTLVVPFVGQKEDDGYSNELVRLFDYDEDTYNYYAPASLTSVTVTSAGKLYNGAFDGCVDIEEINILSDITAIGNYAFRDCEKLTSITIPASVQTIGYDAFVNVSGEMAVAVESDSVKFEIKNNCLVDIDNKTILLAQNNAIIPTDGTVEVIGRYAFNDRGMANISIPSTIKTIEMNAFANCVNLQSINIPASVETIGDSAFAGCSNLRSVEIPNSVLNLGRGVFGNCVRLESITLPYFGESSDGENKYFGYVFGARSAGENVQYVPSSLKTITLTGESVIPESCFSGLSGVETIILSNTITDVGASAFKDCISLKNVNFPSAIEVIKHSMFSGCESLESFEISSSVTTIEYGAFSGTGIKNFVIPSTVTSIPSGILGGSQIESLTMPFIGVTGSTSSIKLFGGIFSADNYSTQGNYVPSTLKTVKITGGEAVSAYAFYGCNNLKNVELPNTITTIGSKAFEGCTSLESLTIPFFGDKATSPSYVYLPYLFGATSNNQQSKVPETLKTVTVLGGSVPYMAFSGCTNIETVVLNEGVTSVESQAFYNCTSLEKLYIPTTLTAFNSYDIFTNCESLAGVYISDIESWCKISFVHGAQSNPVYFAKNLYLDNELVTEVEVPETVTAIGNIAFGYIESLTKVVISDNVKTIGTAAFSSCPNLEVVVIGSGVESMGRNVFSSTPKLTQIFYKGDSASWELIEKTDANITIPIYYYSESEPISDGNYWRYVGGVPTIWTREGY